MSTKYLGDEDSKGEYAAKCLPRLQAAPPAPAPMADALLTIIRMAEKAKEPVFGEDPESPAAIRNVKFSGIAQIAAQGLGWMQGPPLDSAPPAPVADNPWREAVLDVLARCCMDAPQDEPPASILRRVIEAEVMTALDPAVSAEAQALVDRGAVQPAPVAEMIAPTRHRTEWKWAKDLKPFPVGTKLYAFLPDASPSPAPAAPVVTDAQFYEWAEREGYGQSMLRTHAKAGWDAAILSAQSDADGVPAFDATQKCQLEALADSRAPLVGTQCPRCKNPHHACDFAAGVAPAALADANHQCDCSRHPPGSYCDVACTAGVREVPRD